MLTFLSENFGTIITAAVVLTVVIAITVKMAKDKKRGVSPACGCKCSECQSGGCK